jgi:hypothetical protein
MNFGFSFNSWSRVIMATIVATAMSGCERKPTTVETSNLSELEQSLADLREQVDPARRGLFEESLTYLVGGEARIDAEAQSAFPELVLELYRPIVGMTAEEIIVTAQRTRLIEVQLAVAELEEGRVASEQARQDLKPFVLRKSRVYKRNRGFLQWPVIELRAENKTEYKVWLVHFRAALLRPGNAEPWLVEEFDQLVLNGMEPGQRALWRVEPLQEEWVTLIEPHPNLRFTLEVTRLEALGGEVIAATEWGEIEAAKLEIYQQKLEQIKNGESLALDTAPDS